MNIYQALEKDHKEINVLLDELIECSESGDKKWKTLVDKIRDQLIPHSRAEEALFYNAIRELNPKHEVIVQSYTEHALAEVELRTLQAMKKIDVNWTRLAQKLRTDLLAHVEKEEGVVFQVGRETFSDEESKMIGKAFLQLKPTIKGQSFLGTTIDLISNLLPRRLVPGFRKIVSEENEKKSA